MESNILGVAFSDSETSLKVSFRNSGTPSVTNDYDILENPEETVQIKAVIELYEKKFQFPLLKVWPDKENEKVEKILEFIRKRFSNIVNIELEELLCADSKSFLMVICAFFGRHNAYSHPLYDDWILELVKRQNVDTSNTNENVEILKMELMEDREILRKCKYPLYTIMLMCAVANSMADFLEEDAFFHEIRVDDFRKLKSDLEELACDIIESVYYDNLSNAIQILELDYVHILLERDTKAVTDFESFTSEMSNGPEIMAIAYKGKMMKFLSHPACNRLMDHRYLGNYHRESEKTDYGFCKPKFKYILHFIFRILHIVNFCLYLIYKESPTYINVFTYTSFLVFPVIIATFLGNILKCFEASTGSKKINSAPKIKFNFEKWKINSFYGFSSIIFIQLQFLFIIFSMIDLFIQRTSLKTFSHLITILIESFYYFFFAYDTISILYFIRLSHIGFCLHVFKKMIKTVGVFILIFMFLWLILVVIYTSVSHVIVQSKNTLLFEITRKGTFEIFGEVLDDDRHGRLMDCISFNRTIWDLAEMDYIEVSCIFRTSIVPLLLFSYIFFTGILFLNLLTAKLTNEYEKENEKSKYYDGYRKYEQLANIESALFLPPPLTHIYLFLGIFVFICGHKKGYQIFRFLFGFAIGCEDADPKCAEWAASGECSSNAVWMMANCRKSCHSCQGGDRAWKLRTHIQTTYQNTTDNKTRMVRVESVRINNVEIDERRQNVKVFGRFVLSWNDTMVSWDKEQWGLSWLNFYWIQIWTPNIVQINGGSTSNPGQVTSKVLAANYTGQIYLWSDFSFTTPFRFQYDDYPNDVQRVCYKFDDKRLLAVHFTVADGVKNKERESTTDPFVSGWKIDDVDVIESPYTIEQLSDPRRNPFDIQADNCELCISLKRNAVYFTTEMLLPALITSLFTLVAVFFQLSKTQPTILGVSVICQILALILISQRLPSFTAHTPTILKYAGFNMSWTALLFVVSLVLERMATSHVDIPPPHAVGQFSGIVNAILPIPKNSKHEDSSLQYAGFAHALNHVIFALSAILYFIVIICSFVF